jgi:hypothetical protein
MLFSVTSTGGFIENHTLLLCPELSTKIAIQEFHLWAGSGYL